MLGAIIGDLIGSPFEFSPIKHTDFKLFDTSVGGDADTLACITGAIGEAFYGGVPSELALPALDRYIEPGLINTLRSFYGRYSIPF